MHNITLDQKDFNDLIKRAKKLQHNVMVRILFVTGMRTGELCTLRIDNIDLTNKTIKILDSKKKIYFDLFIDDETANLLRVYIEQLKRKTGWLFTDETGNHARTKTIQRMIKRWARELGLNKNWCPRFFRYRFARNWIINKGSITDLQTILRHTQLNTTVGYIPKIRFTSEIENLKREYNRIINSD